MKLPEFKLGTYLAFKLSDKCRADLLKVFTPKFSKVICHHVTIDFNPTVEKLKEFSAVLQDPFKILVFGSGVGDGIECLAVSINGKTIRSDGSFYHVTLSLEPPHKPVESNTLIKSIRMCKKVVLDGTFELLSK